MQHSLSHIVVYCGLVLDDLLVFSKDDERIIYQQLSDLELLAKLSDDGQKRAQHLHHCLSDVLDNQGRFHFVELLSHALQQLGISTNLSPTEVMIKDQFLQIISDCEQQQLLNIETIDAKLDDLYAPSVQAQVKLMTIHQAKGLEFDTVIILGLGRLSRGDDTMMMHIKEFADQSLLLAPIKSTFEQKQNNTY